MVSHSEVNWGQRTYRPAHPPGAPSAAVRDRPAPCSLSQVRSQSGGTASLDAVSAVAADCALSVTAPASPDAAAGAFGAVSAGPVGEAAGGGASLSSSDNFEIGSSNVSFAMHDFASRAACEHAREVSQGMQSELPGLQRIRPVCVPEQ
jgi:hypothetical protein